jgi:hypothetical protein
MAVGEVHPFFPQLEQGRCVLIGLDTFIGSYLGLLRNWSQLVAAAGLTPDEEVEAACRFAARVGFYGALSA